MNEHTCPVCGYSGDTEFYPHDNQICGCCGTEFGYDDQGLSHRQLRALWVSSGFPWFDAQEARPARWNPYRQLVAAGLVSFEPVGNASATTTSVVIVGTRAVSAIPVARL